MADHVLPATHAGTATQASAVAFHAKAGVLQAQRAWPVSALLVLYSCDVPQGVQTESPALAKDCAGHVEQTALLELVQALVVAAPAPQTVQLEQGENAEALHVEPLTQGWSGTHESDGTSQKWLAAQLQLVWLASVPTA